MTYNTTVVSAVALPDGSHFYGVAIYSSKGDRMGWINVDTGQVIRNDFTEWPIQTAGLKIAFPDGATPKEIGNAVNVVLDEWRNR